MGNQHRFTSSVQLHSAGWLLVFLHVLLGCGAIFGGLAMIIDPSGGWLGMPVSLLADSPFNSFLMPGIILLFVLGVTPLIVAISLVGRPGSKLAEKLNPYSDRYWGWTFSLYIGFALMIWIMVQVYWLRSAAVVHLAYFAGAIAIQVVTLLPGVQKKYVVQTSELPLGDEERFDQTM